MNHLHWCLDWADVCLLRYRCTEQLDRPLCMFVSFKWIDYCVRSYSEWVVCDCVCGWGFLELVSEDQMTLLKSSFMELTVLRLSYRSWEQFQPFLHSTLYWMPPAVERLLFVILCSLQWTMPSAVQFSILWAVSKPDQIGTVKFKNTLLCVARLTLLSFLVAARN